MPAREVLPQLPSWCHSIAYRAESDTIELELVLPRQLEAMTPAECEALVEALSRCLNQSRKAAAVLDVDPDPPVPRPS